MEEYRIRAGIFASIILVVLAILGLRLGYMQLIDSDTYVREASNNAFREELIRPARGAIYDRHGALMVSNVPTYSVSLTPRYFPRAKGNRKQYDSTKVSLLARLLAVPDTTVWKRLAEAEARNPDAPTPSFNEVPLETVGRVMGEQYRFRIGAREGVTVEEGQTRKYHTRARASHILGYVREIGQRELERRYDDGYRRRDLIGMTGIERNYEMYLRGKLGLEYRLVNARGLDIGAFKNGAEDSEAISGYDLRLSIDDRVQTFAESLFVGKRGGAVAIDPQTGEILALISKPDYDLSTFTRSVNREMWSYLNNSPAKPMFNRATQSMQPPGSTWKPFMALMALEEGDITPESNIYCGGGHPLGGGRRFRCMHRDGSINVMTAITRSCNTFFFELMNRTDVNTFSRYAHMFGFGERVLTDVAEQTPGLIPDSSYFDRSYGVGKWAVGYWLNLGIGQGDMGTTPFELARYTGIVAAAGKKPAPHLIRELRHRERGEIIRPTLPAPEQVPIKPEHFELVRQGMRGVMEAGTGRSLQIPGIPSGGKTGTAQAGPGRKDNSVFIMFAPYDNPRIAIAVQVENAGFGATAAGPIASLMAELYLTGKIAPERGPLVARALAARSQELANDTAPPRTKGSPRDTIPNRDGPPDQAEPAAPIRRASLGTPARPAAGQR